MSNFKDNEVLCRVQFVHLRVRLFYLEIVKYRDFSKYDPEPFHL